MQIEIRHDRVTQINYRLDHFDLGKAVQEFVQRSPCYHAKLPAGAKEEFELDIDYDDHDRRVATLIRRFTYPDVAENQKS